MAHEIDYKIFGDDMQAVEIELDPNEAVRAEIGAMLYMEDGIEMQTGTEGILKMPSKKPMAAKVMKWCRKTTCQLIRHWRIYS